MINTPVDRVSGDASPCFWFEGTNRHVGAVAQHAHEQAEFDEYANSLLALDYPVILQHFLDSNLSNKKIHQVLNNLEIPVTGSHWELASVAARKIADLGSLVKLSILIANFTNEKNI
jgi:hypothetical protein